MFYKIACIGLLLLFVSYTLGQQQCYVDQHCSPEEVCHKQERESRFFILGICIKLIDMVRPKKPCESHKDCRWYLGKYCDKKAGFCKMIIGWYVPEKMITYRSSKLWICTQKYLLTMNTFKKFFKKHFISKQQDLKVEIHLQESLDFKSLKRIWTFALESKVIDW